MPHCILEYSNNIKEVAQTKKIISKLHSIIMSSSLFQAEDIKIRSQKYDTYYIGNGDTKNGFVHLSLRILSGRSLSAKKELCRNVHNFLNSEYKQSLDALNCGITVEIIEIDKETYSKTLS